MFLKFTKNKFIKGSFLYAIGVIVAGFLGYLFHFAVSRKISVGEYGELQSLLAIFSITGVFSSALSYFIITYTSVFHKFNDYRVNNKFFKLVNSKIRKAATVIFLLFILLSSLMSVFLHLSNIWGLIIIGLSISIGLISVVYSGALSGCNIASSWSALVKLIFGFVLAVLFPYASAMVASFLASTIAGWYLVKHFAEKNILKKESLAGSEHWQEKYFSGFDIKKKCRPDFFVLKCQFKNDILLCKKLERC